MILKKRLVSILILFAVLPLMSGRVRLQRRDL